nr:MAG TPA: pandonodin peptide [Caudoviricetes sp.]
MCVWPPLCFSPVNFASPASYGPTILQYERKRS